MSNEYAESFDKQTPLEILKSSRENVNWEIVKERRKFIHQVYPSIERWGRYRLDDTAGPPPNIQDVFRSEEIECLVMDRINLVYKDKEYINELKGFIRFVACSGYKDEPKLDRESKPSSRRTTPVHHAVKQDRYIIKHEIRQIFEIYNRFDVNYTDESGLSHFHVACKYGFEDAVKKFLELGQDPNCLWSETGDSPLRLAVLSRETREVVELLVRSGADPNLANKEGLTSLHVTNKDYTNLFSRIFIPQDEKILFEISDEMNKPLQVNARAKFGNTPLHVSVVNDNVDVTEMLLRRGADPNSANDEGSTPLHELYKRDCFFHDVKSSVDLFFKICDEVNQSVQVDVVDKLGRTPLQLAVANLWPDCIDVLFEHGADLSSFVFPTDSYFAERYNKSSMKMTFNTRLKLASSALAVVEKIENKGYQLKRSDALTIMKFFAKYELFEKSTDLEKCWYDDEKFIKRAKEIWICPGMSHIPNILHDDEWPKIRKEMKVKPNMPLDEVIRLRPEEAAKLLTYEDYWKFACSYCLMILTVYWNCGKEFEELTALHLCEKLSRGFFKSWALDPFMELIHDRLPILCCEMVIEELKNKDLYNICLAAAGQIS